MSGVSRQDTPNRVFKNYAGMIDSLFAMDPRLIYVSGHDHNLQLIVKDGITQVVSGAGSKTNYAGRGHGARFVYQGRGFSRIKYFNNGQVWIEYYSSSADRSTSPLVYHERLR